MTLQRTTYSMEDQYGEAWDAADKLRAAAAWPQDCLSVLCTLSGVGEWEIDENGRMVYRAPCTDTERGQLTETGVYPVETYGPGDTAIPTLVAQHFGLGEVAASRNAGYLLQSKIDRPVYRIQQDTTGNSVIVETTLRHILEEDGDEDIEYKTLEWRHIQEVVDSAGGQQERFLLLADILHTRARAEMDAATFVPYGDEFADSDFIDAF